LATLPVAGGMLALQGGDPVLEAGSVAPWPQILAEDSAAVLRALETSTPWQWPFKEVTRLESAWASYVDRKYCIATNSGTSALHMCVAAADVEPGDEVLVPADTFLASATCVLHANAIPVFVDTDPVTFTIDPAQAGQHVGPRTRAMVAVDLHGLPADYGRLREVANRYGLFLIEDASQAHGATYRGRRAGSLGDASACSINGSKCLSGLGEGGLFTTDAADRRDLAARLCAFDDEYASADVPGYHSRIMGWNYRMDVLAAAFAHSQLQRLPEMTSTRIENGTWLAKALSGLPAVRLPEVPPDRSHVFFLCPILVEPEAVGLDKVPVTAFRRTLKDALRAEGVPIQESQTIPLPGLAMFRQGRGYGRGCPWTCTHASPGREYSAADYPVASDICQRRLVLGHSYSSFGPPNSLQTMHQIADAFVKVLAEHRDDLIRLVKESAQETAH
jgi:perosamine synthetase